MIKFSNHFTTIYNKIWYKCWYMEQLLGLFGTEPSKVLGTYFLSLSFTTPALLSSLELHQFVSSLVFLKPVQQISIISIVQFFANHASSSLTVSVEHQCLFLSAILHWILQTHPNFRISQNIPPNLGLFYQERS